MTRERADAALTGCEGRCGVSLNADGEEVDRIVVSFTSIPGLKYPRHSPERCQRIRSIRAYVGTFPDIELVYIPLPVMSQRPNGQQSDDFMYFRFSITRNGILYDKNYVCDIRNPSRSNLGGAERAVAQLQVEAHG